MHPKIILHNQISLDGSLTKFSVNMQLHYQILGTFKADAHLIGSNTAKSGLEQFLEEIPPETPRDKKPPILKPDDSRPYWVLIDSHAQMYKLLHIFRQFDYCKDLIVLITPNTPQKYQTYLQKRKYNTIVSGNNHIDFPQIIQKLYQDYQIKTIITDTGPTLNSVLLSQRLLDEISLIIAPEIVGNKPLNLFQNLTVDNIPYHLRLLTSKTYENKYIHLHYKIEKTTGGKPNS